MATYSTTWRNKWLTSEAKSIDDMINALAGAAEELREMKNAGITLEDNGGVGDDYATLVTNDPKVAEKFHMEEEEVFEEEDFDDEFDEEEPQ